MFFFKEKNDSQENKKRLTTCFQKCSFLWQTGVIKSIFSKPLRGALLSLRVIKSFENCSKFSLLIDLINERDSVIGTTSRIFSLSDTPLYTLGLCSYAFSHALITKSLLCFVCWLVGCGRILTTQYFRLMVSRFFGH